MGVAMWGLLGATRDAKHSATNTKGVEKASATRLGVGRTREMSDDETHRLDRDSINAQPTHTILDAACLQAAVATLAGARMRGPVSRDDCHQVQI